MSTPSSSIRVRFAPSPTGYLHVGGARTALFNWLYARQQGGTFVLRIEDTDVERSSWEMVEGILASLRWLGLDWDEGPEVGGPHAPYFQSERLDRYRAVADALVAAGHAYKCYCDPDELKAAREAATARGEDGSYDRRCLRRTVEEIAALERDGRPAAIRFKVPPGRTTFADAVHGTIDFDHAHIEDFVLLRSDRHPTYQLTVVVDDVDMAITHVVRGDDHISNTPKQILIYGALGRATPTFAHVPLILGPDKKRLSKRHGATSVTDYRDRGFLPQAMVNFLALLGWSPGTDEEVLTLDDLVRQFSLARISGGNAVFNPEKLEWLNGQHLARLSPDVLTALLEPTLVERALWRDGLRASDRDWWHRVLELLKPRARMLDDLVAGATPFLANVVVYDPAAVAKHLSAPDLAAHVAAVADAFERLPSFDRMSSEEALRGLAESRGVKAATLIHATRVAVTGQANSPGLFEVLELVGRDRVCERLRRAPIVRPPIRYQTETMAATLICCEAWPRAQKSRR